MKQTQSKWFERKGREFLEGYMERHEHADGKKDVEILSTHHEEEEMELRAKVLRCDFLDGIFVSPPNTVKYSFTPQAQGTYQIATAQDRFKKETLDGPETWLVSRVYPEGVKLRSPSMRQWEDWEDHLDFASMIANGTIIEHEFSPRR